MVHNPKHFESRRTYGLFVVMQINFFAIIGLYEEEDEEDDERGAGEPFSYVLGSPGALRLG